MSKADPYRSISATMSMCCWVFPVILTQDVYICMNVKQKFW